MNDTYRQMEFKLWIQNYVCCVKQPRSNMKWNSGNRKLSKARREGSRVTFSRKVNKVEPLFIDQTGELKQRSYISLLSSTSEDSIDEELRLFVEKYVAQTVYDAAAKYQREKEREMRLRIRSESKFNDIRKFSVIREVTELSEGKNTDNDVAESTDDSDLNGNNIVKGFSVRHNNTPPVTIHTEKYDKAVEYEKEDTLSKSNFLGSSDENDSDNPFPSGSFSDDSYIYDADSASCDSISDLEEDKTPKQKVITKKNKKIKLKTQDKPKLYSENVKGKKNKVAPNTQSVIISNDPRPSTKTKRATKKKKNASMKRDKRKSAKSV